MIKKKKCYVEKFEVRHKQFVDVRPGPGVCTRTMHTPVLNSTFQARFYGNF